MSDFLRKALKSVENIAPQDNRKKAGPHKAAYYVYSVISSKRKGQKPIWFKIGVAFRHKDEGGFDVVLNAIPLDGRIALRLPKAKEKDSLFDEEAGRILSVENSYEFDTI